MQREGLTLPWLIFHGLKPTLLSTSHSSPDRGTKKAGKYAHYQGKAAKSHAIGPIAQISLAAGKKRLMYGKGAHGGTVLPQEMQTVVVA